MRALHEFIGVVHEVGSSVQNLEVGDGVMTAAGVGSVAVRALVRRLRQAGTIS